ncbi:MAG TPA: mechanosensitive ion channel domain-containing protein, partial [Pseudomonadales bacterium]|nr:mechanosensitive ion channel domain-containing protein [Pseudomonadales bacterium]
AEYIDALGALGDGFSDVQAQTREYRTFLEALLLWIPDHPPLWVVDAPTVLAELEDARAMFMGIRLQWTLQTLIALALALLLLRNRAYLRLLQGRLNARVEEPRDHAIGHTLWAVAAVLLRALPVPLLLFSLAAALDGDASVASATLRELLMITATLVLSLDLMRRIAEPDGIGQLHFGWSSALMARWHAELGFVVHACLPVVLLAALLSRMAPSAGHEVLGRVLILVALLMIGVRLGREMHTELRALGAVWFDSTLNRVRVLLQVLIVTMAGAIIWGQVFSVRMIAASLVDTVWVTVGLLLAHALLMRWLAVARSRLRTRERLQAPAQRTGSEEGGAVDERVADLSTISSATEQLVHVAVIAVAVFAGVTIWGPLLPAFEGLSRIELWSSSTVVDGVTVVTQITLANVVIVMGLAGLTLFAAGRLPALIEMMLRSRTSISPGARYTVSTLLNYSIIGVGTIAGLSALGLHWESLQWLVAALGVGIGFGLQEIVANFISGVIILFERPIRVGDIVTIGDKDGTVTRIRIRATTIRDWDGKELLVPNKEFVTERLLNWTLSDSQTRVVIDVGIAYGSKVEEALRILQEVTLAHPRVLAEPPPLVVFEHFGDNALELSARCFLDSVEGRLEAMTELRTAINAAFADAGIVIAYPQRDVHLDVTAPIRIAMEPGQALDARDDGTASTDGDDGGDGDADVDTDLDSGVVDDRGASAAPRT